MGSVVYEFLNDSLLFDPTLIAENYVSVPDARLASELQRYREHCLKNLGTLKEEISGTGSSLRLFAGAAAPQLQMLKQAALYLDTVVIADPLFPHTRPSSEFSKAISASLAMSSDNAPNRVDIAKAAALMRHCRPMVAVGYVRIFPVTLLSEPPSQIPIRYSPTAFRDLLAPDILARYKSAVKVVSLKPVKGGLEFLDNLHPCRAIAIEFETTSPPSTYVYVLHEQEVLAYDKQEGTVQFRWTLPSDAPPQDLFEHWVNQSVNQAAASHFDGLAQNVAISSISGSNYLTSSKFEAEILRTANASSSVAQSIQSSTLDAVLGLELQAFENLSVDDLMTARMDMDAFAMFRRELEKQFRELRTEQDPAKLKIKTENAMHELVEIQLTRVSQAITSLRKRLAMDAILVGTGFASTIVTSGAGVYAGITATALGYKHFTDYKKAIHENPAYFLWKAGLRP